MRLTIAGKNGSLHQYTQKVTNKRGEIVEYPKVKGERDPHNVKHWKWHYQILKACKPLLAIIISLYMYYTISFA